MTKEWTVGKTMDIIAETKKLYYEALKKKKKDNGFGFIRWEDIEEIFGEKLIK